MSFPTADDFRAEAEQLREFADQAADPEVAEKYRQMAARFEAIARSVELARALR